MPADLPETVEPESAVASAQPRRGRVAQTWSQAGSALLSTVKSASGRREWQFPAAPLYAPAGCEELADCDSPASPAHVTQRGAIGRWIEQFRHISRTAWVAIFCAAGLIAVLSFTATRFRQGLGQKSISGLETQSVRRKPMRIVVSNRGTVDSANSAVVSSNVEWRTQIIDLVPEGTWVEKGAVLCELDSSVLTQKLTERQINLTRSEAAFRQAQEALALQNLTNDRDIAAAELKLKLARLDLDKFKRGDYPQQTNTIETQITLARETLTRSKAFYDFVKRMAMKGYRSLQDVEQARIEVVKAEAGLEAGEGKQHVLRDFMYKRTMTELEATAKEMERRLSRVKVKCEMAILQADAQLNATERSALIFREALKRIQNNLKACIIRAPQAGEVVYANDETRGTALDSAIKPGAEVRYQQAILKLPDPTRMKVETRIHESLISMIATGQPTKINVEAFGDCVFHGKVTSVSSVPVKNDPMRPDLKEFQAIIQITDAAQDVRRLKPGLTADVEIEVDSRDSVLQVPVNAVVEVAGEHIAFVVGPDGPEPRPVSLGKSDRFSVEIVDGLNEGEDVVMSPRTYLADELAEFESQLALAKANTPATLTAEASHRAVAVGKSIGE